MRAILFGFLFSILKVFTHPVLAQKKVASIEQNTNVLAKELHHSLNATNDTILLRSKERMHYVYSINSQDQREVDQFVESNELSIPIEKLSQGKHLFVVSYLQRKIVFVVRVYDPHASYIYTKRVEDVATRNN